MFASDAARASHEIRVGSTIVSEDVMTNGGSTADGGADKGGSFVPRYVTVADFLRGMIYNHELEPGEKIPSEHQLMDHFDIARGTARHAIKILADEGLLKQAHGRGTFVSRPDITHDVSRFPLSIAQSLSDQGKSFETHVLCSKVEVPPPAIQVALDVKPGVACFYIQRVRSVAGEPMVSQEDWVSLVECPGVDKVDYATETMFDAIERISGHKIKQSHMTYSARNVGREIGASLGCEESTAVLVLEQLISLDDGSPVSWGRTWFKPGQTVTGTTSI